MDVRERIVSYLWVLFASYVTAIDGSLSEIERHLELGKQFLAKGQFADSLTHYHAAVDLDPDNYQTLYRRATVYLAMGKSKSALPDLDKVVQLKSDFTAARIQRGNVLLKQGDLDGAQTDFEAVLANDANQVDAKSKLDSLTALRENIDLANRFYAAGDLASAEFYFSKAIELCQWYPDLYEKRAICYESFGDLQKAIADIRAVTRLVADSTKAYYKISELYYSIGDIDQSLGQVRECLKLNPDDKQCFPHYKRVKKLAKMKETLDEHVRSERWMECLDEAEKILKFERNVVNIQNDVYRVTCKCNVKAGHASEALTVCTEVLRSVDENDVDVLCDRAEAYILNEQYDEAIEDFQKAHQANQESQRAREGLERAKKLQKQTQRRDYYKILGVRRNANKRDVMKAYRRLAQQWHPDNFSDENEKKRAEAKFIDIAAAKEVLTDPEKRERFDRGEDPLDPEQQQGGHGHPFYGGFPFGGGGQGGGPFTFKFHFG
jgi:DnaJ family protein C protein 3